MGNTTLHFHRHDLPADVVLVGDVAIDTETTGLSLVRDRLCLLQLQDAAGNCHLIQFEAGKYEAPHLVALLTDPERVKIFHFARFDLAVVARDLGVQVYPIYCTKVASKLVRTYTDRHGLKDLCRELIGVELSKEQQSSDWAAAELSKEQQQYAAADVKHLHALRERLNMMLEREGRVELAQACFDFLPARSLLDLAGWAETDIFAH